MLLKENILWFELYTQVFECLYLMNINFVLMLLKIRRQLWLNSIQLSICNFKLLFLQIKHVVMLNCGANIDVIEFLQPEEYVKFYICDR